MAQGPPGEFSDPGPDDDAGPSTRPGRGVAQGAAPDDDRLDAPGPDRDDDAARPRRVRRLLVPAVGLLVLAVVSGVLLLSQERDRRTPQAAVQAYVDLVEAGDLEAATALVPVPGSSEVVRRPPPAIPSPDESRVPGRTPTAPPPLQVVRNAGLLTSDSYAANPGMTDVVVSPPPSGSTTAVGATVQVPLTYVVRDFPAATTLRVERLPDAFPGLPVWRVVDSLAVPTIVRTDDPDLGRTSLSGVPAEASGEEGEGYEQIATMLYPGVYPVTFDEGTYLSADPLDLRVAAPREPVLASDVAPATGVLRVGPSNASYDLATAEAAAFLDGCAAATTDADAARCPDAYREELAAGTRATFVTGITRVGLQAASGTTPDGDVRPYLLGWVEGTVVVSTPDGARNEPFSLQLTVTIDGDDATVRVASTPVLGQAGEA